MLLGRGTLRCRQSEDVRRAPQTIPSMRVAEGLYSRRSQGQQMGIREPHTAAVARMVPGTLLQQCAIPFSVSGKQPRNQARRKQKHSSVLAPRKGNGDGEDLS